jgi:hypothetical protein
VDHAKRPRFAALLLSAIATLALAGCTSSGGRHDALASSGRRPTATSSTGVKKVAGLPAGVTGATSVPAHVANNVRLRHNVQLSTCQRAAHGWSAAGTARNPTGKPVQYTITVFFTTATTTVVGTGATHVRVGPGRSARWVVSPHFTPAPKTLCVLTGVG